MAWVLGVVKRMMERFVPPGGDADSQRRARLVVAYSLAIGAAAVLYSACYVALGLPLSALGAGIASLAFLAGPWLMRRSGSLALAANTVALGGWVGLVLINAAEGGIRSPAIGWFALVPWSAIMLAGSLGGLVWTMLTVATLVVFAALAAGSGLDSEVPTTLASSLRDIDNITLTLLAAVLAWRYEAAKDRALAAVRTANTKLARARDEERATAEHLRRVQDQLVAEAQQQRKLELELRQAQKLEAVGRLAAGVAHEINTPLQFVRDSLQFVSESTADLTQLIGRYRSAVSDPPAGAGLPDVAAELRELDEEADLPYLEEQMPIALARTRDGLARMSTIVTAMKGFARADQAEAVDVDLNRAVLDTLIITASEYRHVASVETELEEDLPRVSCRAGEINQVLLNVIVNAAHAIADVVSASGAMGRIRVRTQSVDDGVRISVADSGGGIPEAIRDRIFDPFFTTKDVGRGTGQGLAIARAIVVDHHGGQLDFETEPGRGTTFHILLPRVTPTRVVPSVAA